MPRLMPKGRGSNWITKVLLVSERVLHLLMHLSVDTSTQAVVSQVCSRCERRSPGVQRIPRINTWPAAMFLASHKGHCCEV